MAPAPWWRTPPGCCWIRRASSRASRCPTLRPFRAGCRALWKEACRSEEHTSELQSLMRISYAVFCLKKKNTQKKPKEHYRDHETSNTDNRTEYHYYTVL